MPKTASTSVTRAFVRPMMSVSGLFVNVANSPNTCILGPGGCRSSWGRKSAVGEEVAEIAIVDDDDDNRTRSIDYHPPPPPIRCLPKEERYDVSRRRRDMVRRRSATSTILGRQYSDFGPDGPRRKRGRRRYQERRERERIAAARHALGPAMNTHVGLDTSLFGWILPNRPMVFSTFRDPVDRLLSSFHYGIRYGGGMPGEVDKCALPGTSSDGTLAGWQADVVSARRIVTTTNDTSVYVGLLRDYLTSCRNAADNAYVQFLDPRTKDVRVALENLERHVIVGLQSDLDGTLMRFRDVALRSCVGHPKFREMETVLSGSLAAAAAAADNGDGYFRKSATRVVASEGGPRDGELAADDWSRDDATVDAVELAPPDVNAFDDDLQRLVREMTAGDEVIYKRALELYYQAQ
ncbi:hypothetical protein ACHAW5_007344 [Stephanodiscus triporus]|uniref:Protein-tyrosine sulfotransferase n=1 Tax=Stephanodiscus triporus TaxID=2934178 RepID=A0ABD3N6K2_9STRA